MPVRHEQGGAYMADAYGRLTGQGRASAWERSGPGATNLVTAVADAFLDRAPLVALTGQSDLERMHKESHQYIDLIGIMRPVVKWNARVSSPEIVPEVVRKAFKVAESEKPGSTHLELPEDVMGRPLDASPLPRHAPVQPEPGMEELQRATEIILGASNPVILAGNGAIRTHASRALRAFVHTTGIPVAETFMAKGLLDYEDPHALGTVGLQSRDYAMAGFDDADVVIAVGYDLVEHAPEHWNPARRQADRDDRHGRGRDRRVLHSRGRARRRYRARAGTAGRRLQPRAVGRRALVPPARARAGSAAEARDDDHFPMRPPRVLADIRQALGPTDLLVSDVGLHKLWIGRMFPAHEPGTVLIANGLAGMGFALPTGIAAKLVQPDRSVVTVSGDGGFLMNCQELETADAPRDGGRQRDLGERRIRLDRLEAGQEVRPPLRCRVRQSGLRRARRVVRHARVALRDARASSRNGSPKRSRSSPVGDRRADRLLDRRRDFARARRRDRGHLSPRGRYVLPRAISRRSIALS